MLSNNGFGNVVVVSNNRMMLVVDKVVELMEIELPEVTDESPYELVMLSHQVDAWMDTDPYTIAFQLGNNKQTMQMLSKLLMVAYKYEIL